MGRPAGLPNKNKRALMARLKDIYGEEFHPIMQVMMVN